MSLKDRAKEELGALVLATGYFGFWVGVLLMFKTLLLADYHMPFHHWSAVIVGVLVLAKVVLVLEHLSLGRWLGARPAWMHVVFRAVLCALGVLVVMVIERGISERSEHPGIPGAIRSALHGANAPHLWTNALCITGALLGYSTLSVIRLQLGEGSLSRLFLEPLPRERRLTHAVSSQPMTAPPSNEYTTMLRTTPLRTLTIPASLIVFIVTCVSPAWAQKSPGESAANGPFPGDVSLYERELAIAAQHTSPGYFPSLNAAEISGSERSGFFPAASFTGSFDGPNAVYAWRSVDRYQGLTYICNRRPGELYLVGGDYPPSTGPMPPGPYVAKADATTGEQVWRTYVDNANVSGRWIGNANLNIMDDGNIPFAWSNQIVLIDGDTGQILKHGVLPAGQAPAVDVNYKHLTIAPDRTLILKCQTRPTGETSQGTMAIFKGLMKGLKQPNSHLCAVDPESLEVLHDIALPEPASAPHIITDHHGRTAIYVPVDSGLIRCFWDADSKKLSIDESWQVSPMREGQSAATAATVVGDWIAVQTNGVGSDTVASSIVVAHRDDSSRMNVIFPFGDLGPGEWSFAPPKAGADPENNMIYSADMGVGKVAGIRIDPSTGKLDVAFVIDNATTTFQPVIGPKDRRVLLLTNAMKNNPSQPMKQVVFSGNYTEQLTWRDAATGRLLAESGYFEPLTINSLTAPGFGGRVYFPTIEDFVVLQPLPAKD